MGMEPFSRGHGAGAINPFKVISRRCLAEKTVHQGLQLVGVHVETQEGRDDSDRCLQERLVFSRRFIRSSTVPSVKPIL